MQRYCKNCKGVFDFSAEEVIAKADLICPNCGSIIPKNSTVNPATDQTGRLENKIGNALGVIFYLSFMFYVTLSVIGIIAYFTGFYTLLYVMTGIILAVFIIQLITDTLFFRLGIILVPAGAVAGFFLIKGIPGACLGILLVFLIRHILRDLLFRFIGWIINKTTTTN